MAEGKPTIEELQAALTEVEGKLVKAEARRKREEDFDARDDARDLRKARNGIMNGRELMAERIASDTDPRWLEFLRTREHAIGSGWFLGLFEQQDARFKDSPAAWLDAISKAIEIRDTINPVVIDKFPELKQVITDWLERVATPGLKKACGTGRF